MNPQIIAYVRLLPSVSGGRKGPTPSGKFGCVLRTEEKCFDCRFLLDKIGSLVPGESYEVPIAFLDPANAIAWFQRGAEFELWEGKIIGSGKVIDTYPS